MKTKLLFLILVIFFSIIFFVFFKGLKISNVYTPKNNIEKKIPSFSSVLLGSEKEINSDEIFKGDDFYLLNIWSSWCIPCREEHPHLLNLSKQKDVYIIGLNYKDKDKNALNFLKQYNNPYFLSFTDHKGTLAIEWGAYGVPESFLVHNNKIIKKIIGPLSDKKIIEIKELIK